MNGTNLAAAPAELGAGLAELADFRRRLPVPNIFDRTVSPIRVARGVPIPHGWPEALDVEGGRWTHPNGVQLMHWIRRRNALLGNLAAMVTLTRRIVGTGRDLADLMSLEQIARQSRRMLAEDLDP